MAKELVLPEGYPELIAAIKSHVQAARTRAALAVNREQLDLYWQIGKEILERETTEGWGAKVVDRLAADLKKELPGVKGLSRRNLLYMRALAVAWPDGIVQQVVAQIPWGHNIALLERLDDPKLRLWYAQKAVENGWSRAVLVHQIEGRLDRRLGAASSNLPATLPKPDSELMQQVLKDPYDFGFLELPEEVAERRVEVGLIAQIRQTLLELGIGFAFVGSQVPLDVGGDDFFPDLVFFHIPTNRYVVIDLKAGQFKPEFAGKMSFYVAVIDDQLRLPHHNPTVGIILCKGRNAQVADYSLQGTAKPVVVATYTTRSEQRQEVLAALPPGDDLEASLEQAPETEIVDG